MGGSRGGGSGGGVQGGWVGVGKGEWCKGVDGCIGEGEVVGEG